MGCLPLIITQSRSTASICSQSVSASTLFFIRYGTRPRHGGVGGIDGGGGGGEFEEQGKVDSVMVQVSSGG